MTRITLNAMNMMPIQTSGITSPPRGKKASLPAAPSVTSQSSPTSDAMTITTSSR